MKHVNILFCWGQIILGVALAALILFISSTYTDSLQTSLSQANGLLTSVENQLDVSIQVLTKFNATLGDMGGTVDTYQETISSVRTSSTALSKTAATWGNESQQFSTIVLDASHIMDTFQQQLPIRVPAVEVQVKPVSFDIPTGLDIRQDKMGFNYPASAEAKVQKEGINYPKGAKVRNCNKRIAGVGISYPCGIEVEMGKLEFNVPHSIDIGFKEFNFNIPRIHAPTFEHIEFNVPDTVKVEYRELMKDEKALLVKTGSQLISTAAAISDTSQSLIALSNLLAPQGDVAKTLKQVGDALEKTQGTIIDISTHEIPTFIDELKKQKETLVKTKTLFADLSGAIVPITWAFMIFPLMIILNGVVLLSLARKF
ncbi:MAG: hypothetical protein R3C14_26205 [Caldilineaceae bacterium]